jgi:DNA (cytosine-5)-methyltransferase 1
VFLVGYSGTDCLNPAAVLFDRESLRGNPAPRREAGQIPAPTIAARTKGGGGLGTDFDLDGGLIPLAFGGGNTSGPIDIATAQTAHGTRLDFDSETFVAHTLRGEGFDASEDGSGRGTPLVPVQITEEMADSLTVGANQTTGFSSPSVVAYRTTGNSGCYETGDIVGALTTQTDQNSQIIASGSKDHGADAMAECSPTLRAGGHSASHANAGVPPAIAFDLRGREGGAMPEGPHETAAIRAASGGSSRSYLAAAPDWVVRRLTPVECERLQGFPDGWTAIPYGKKPADKCPDGPRYKALGNSMAVNVMVFIGERLDRLLGAMK